MPHKEEAGWIRRQKDEGSMGKSVCIAFRKEHGRKNKQLSRYSIG
jgi:hypothetical protein